MASTLIIGIGTTGLRIIEEAQQYHFDFTGKNKPGTNVEFFYIETDVSQKPRKTQNGETDIEIVEFPLGGMAVDITKLKKKEQIDSSWIPEVSAVLQSDSGAGGMPSYGRLAFWGNDNYNTLKETIRVKYGKIRGDEETQILIVGSLTGGTGSGIVVDVAYLVKKITGSSTVNAMLLLPDANSLGTNQALHENSFSALSAITHYTDISNKYSITWPDGSSTEDDGPPFQFTQFLSQDFTGPEASITSLPELIKVAGMVTNLHILNTDGSENYFYDLLKRRRVDSSGNGRIKNFISSGYYMIQFPKAQMEELVSIELTSELLNSLIDRQNFLDAHGNQNSIKGEEINIQHEGIAKIESIIENALKSFDSIVCSDGNVIEASALNQVSKIINKEHDKSSNKRFLFDSFSTKNTGSYFHLLKNNDVLFKDAFISEIYEFIADKTNSIKNLEITRIGISSISAAIDAVINYYVTDLNISGEDLKWDSYVQNTIDSEFKSKTQYEFLGMKKNHLETIVTRLLRATKIHSMLPILKDIKEHLGHPQLPIYNRNRIELPSLASINKIEKRIAEVLKGEGEDGNYTFKKRNSEINNGLDQFSTSFKMVYEHGTKKEDLQIAMKKYKSPDQEKLKLESLFNTNEIWKYISSTTSDFYGDCINNSLDVVRGKKLFDTKSLIQILKDVKPNNPENQQLLELFKRNGLKIKEQVPAMVSLEPTKFSFGQDSCAKLMVLTSDHRQYNGLFNEYQIDYKNDNTVDLPSLGDVIILYQEYGFMGDLDDPYFNPLDHLITMKDVKKHVSNRLDETYKKEKIPYLTIEQIKKHLV